MVQSVSAGTVLGNRYKVLGLIAQGGMGAVYKCSDTRLAGRLCAVKETWIDPKLSPAQLKQMQEQFKREATTLATLDHPNLPKVSDYFSSSGRHYLVMDYVTGQDLLTLLKTRPTGKPGLPWEHVLEWAEQLCSALHYLHTQNPPILHRDIKPANIKLADSGLIKLVDFGLVKWMAPDDNSTITVIQGLGTLAYTPLEQYGGDTGHTDPRTDIYALGATLYHLITGQPPASAKERFLRPDSLIPPRQIVPDLPPHVAEAILRAMAMHPQDRPSSAGEFRALLNGEGSLLPFDALQFRPTWAAILHRDLALVILASLLLLASLLVSLGL